jgi:hypothetical protein
LLHYARLLDIFDRLLDGGKVSEARHQEVSRFHSTKSTASHSDHLRVAELKRSHERSTYIWANEKLRKQVTALGEVPVVELF